MLFQMVCSVLLTVLHLKTLLLIGCEISTANQNPTNKWFLVATQRAKRSTPSERALKTELKTGVRLFCGILFDLICCMTSSVPRSLGLVSGSLGLVPGSLGLVPRFGTRYHKWMGWLGVVGE